jgi:hypothetical protein
VSIVKNKVPFLLDEKRVEVIPDQVMVDWSLSGPLSRLVNDDGDYWILNLDSVDQLETDENVTLHGPTLVIDKSTKDPMFLRFADGSEYKPEDGALWTLSKLHFQAAATFLLPGRFHGNIHFGLPCTAAASLHTLPNDSVLYQLLAPHFRFTLRINNEALRVQRAQDRSKPYAPFPMSGDEFAKSIAEDVQERLIEPGFQTPHWSLSNTDLPYNQFGQAYYDVIKPFVAEVLAHANSEEVETWQQWIAQYVPDFENADAVDAIATLIWQVTVLHSADHYTMEHLMEAHRYIFAQPHLPMPSKSSIQEGMSDAQVVSLMCDPEDRYRSNVFARTFVAGHKHWMWDNSMANIAYKFRDSVLKDEVTKFDASLQNTESKLESKGLNLTPLSKIFQSICW